MAESSWPWDPPGSGSAIQAAQYRTLATAWGIREPGVLRGVLNELQPTTGTGVVHVASGHAACNGVIYENSASLDLNVPNNATGAIRYDMIVVRYTWASKTARLTYITGNASVSGVTLTANTTTWDIPIALVAVAIGGSTPSVSDHREFALAHGGAQIIPATVVNLAGNDDIGASGVWPGGCQVPNLYVPRWATRVRARASVTGVFPVTSSVTGILTLALGNITVLSRTLVWDPSITPNGENSGRDLVLEADADCSSLAGTVDALQLIGLRQSGTGTIRANAHSTATIGGLFLPD